MDGWTDGQVGGWMDRWMDAAPGQRHDRWGAPAPQWHLGHEVRREGATNVLQTLPLAPSTLLSQHRPQPAGRKPETDMKQQHRVPSHKYAWAMQRPWATGGQ